MDKQAQTKQEIDQMERELRETLVGFISEPLRQIVNETHLPITELLKNLEDKVAQVDACNSEISDKLPELEKKIKKNGAGVDGIKEQLQGIQSDIKAQLDSVGKNHSDSVIQIQKIIAESESSLTQALMNIDTSIVNKLDDLERANQDNLIKSQENLSNNVKESVQQIQGNINNQLGLIVEKHSNSVIQIQEKITEKTDLINRQSDVFHERTVQSLAAQILILQESGEKFQLLLSEQNDAQKKQQADWEVQFKIELKRSIKPLITLLVLSIVAISVCAIGMVFTWMQF